MNRYVIIFIAVLSVLSVAAFGIGLYLRSSTSTSPAQEGLSTGVSTTDSQTESTNTNSSATQSVTSTPSNAESVAAVKETYQQALDADNIDNTQLYETSVSGGYALQSWAGTVMSGEGLLKYDTSQNKWVIVDPGGGAWTVGDLVSFTGMPTSTAIALLAGMPQ